MDPMVRMCSKQQEAVWRSRGEGESSLHSLSHSGLFCEEEHEINHEIIVKLSAMHSPRP